MCKSAARVTSLAQRSFADWKAMAKPRIVDSEERILEIIPLVAEMMDTGMMASSDVEVMRVQNWSSGQSERLRTARR